ncbi:MAG: NAD(P)/FAD-dependent oxidoreductase [Iamia sp.]
MSSTSQVVIVGGGFAGVACAQELAREGVSVTLVDQHTYHQFQPLLYQVATAQLAPSDIMAPLRGLFRKDPSVLVKEGEVVSVDPATHTVETATGETFSGDHLVLAVGARADFFGVTGAEEHALPLYTAADAERLRDRVLQLFEDADLDPSRVDRGALTFVVVGAGPTGVETAGALADLVHDVMPERYHDLDVGRTKIVLIDHGDTVLRPFSDKAHAYAAKVLTHKGVQLELGASVEEVAADRVVLGDGTELPTRCVVWAGGLKARALAGTEDMPRGRGGRITIGHDLAVEGFPGVYAIGDVAAAVAPDGATYPQLGSVALQAGKAAGQSILASRDGRSAPPFRYHDKGIMAMIGKGAAVAELGAHHHELHGPVAYSAWLGVHAWLLSSIRARLDAFMSWAWDSFSQSRSPAIIDSPNTPRIDWGDHDDEGAPGADQTKGHHP